MTFVRNLISDLVSRRLWPVAVVLLVALVAAPVLLKGQAEEPPAPIAAAPASVDSTPVISVADERSRGGRGPIGRNPFVQPKVASPDEAGSGGAASGGASGGTSSSAGGSSTLPGVVPVGDDSFGDVDPGSVPGLGDVGAVPVGGGTGSGTKTDNASWHVDLRFGQDGKLANRSDVPRLSPLPSAADPFFVFLGVLADGKTALFLVSSDAEATGDGKCLPSAQSCERVEMQAGDTEFFDVTTPAGDTVQYQLDLVRVQRRTAASTAVATAARTRESSEGREVLRSAVDTGQVEVSDLAYSEDLGLVLPSGGETATGGSLFGGFRVDLRFGSPGELVKRYNLARLTPLPSVEKPAFVFLGVLEDEETALFLNPTEAAASGDAVCKPSPEECQRVELKAGGKASFAAPTIDGQTEEYELDVDAITKLRVATPEEAEASKRRESPAGRIVLRRLVTEVGSLVEDLSFSGAEGVVKTADAE